MTVAEARADAFQPLILPEPGASARLDDEPSAREAALAFARRHLAENEHNVKRAVGSMFDALEDPVLWADLGAEILTAGCQHLCRCAMSDDRSEVIGAQRERGTCTSPSLADQGKRLVRAYGMEDPFVWPVPYVGKLLGDCTPEDLEDAAQHCYAMSATLRSRGDTCRALAKVGKSGKPLRETASADRCGEILAEGGTE